MAEDVLSGLDKKVPNVNVLWAGFPCQDVSFQSQISKEARLAQLEAVMQGRLRTGSVFLDGIKAYIENHGKAKSVRVLRVVLLENVLGLASKIAGLGSDKQIK